MRPKISFISENKTSVHPHLQCGFFEYKHLQCAYIHNAASQMLTLYPSRCKREGTGNGEYYFSE